MVGVTDRRTLELRQTRATVEECGKLVLVRKLYAVTHAEVWDGVTDSFNQLGFSFVQ